jgi:tetratricopeptide (TPR) repeat protein
MAEKTTDDRAHKWLGPLYNNTGWTYFDLKQYDKAMDLFEKSLAWRQEQKDEEGTFIAQWTIARTLRETGEIEKALELQQSLEKARNEKGLDPDGYVFEEIAECLLALNQGNEAKPYFHRAYDILSKDQWLVANEPKRLERMKALSE